MPNPAAAAVVGGSLVSGAMGASAAKSAAKKAAQGAQSAIDEQRRQFDLAMGLQRPYSVTGTAALNQLAQIYGLPYQQYQDPNAIPDRLSIGDVLALLGKGMSVDDIAKIGALDLNTGQSQQRGFGISAVRQRKFVEDLLNAGLSEEQIQQLQQGQQPEIITPSGPSMAGFTASPDYQFRRDEGLRDIGNSFAARGGAFSGNALRGITDFNSGLAAGEFGNYYNRLANLAGIGQTAANASGGFAANTGANIANLMGQQADARASGILGQANSIGGAINSGLTNWMLYRGGMFGGGRASPPPSSYPIEV